MRRTIARIAVKLDWTSIIAALLLAGIGLVAIYSVALGSSEAADFVNFKKQALYVALGFAVLIGIAVMVDYRALSRYSTVAYILAAILLVAVLVWGRTIRGTTGWFSLGVFSFQPVEVAKICAIIFLAKFFSDKARFIGDVRYLAASSVGLIALVGLVLFQPDFGSAMILASLWGGYILLSGIRWPHLLLMVAVAAVAALALWFFAFQDYQRDRIRVFLDPSLDPLGRGYNVTQATIAIGSGGWFGKGVGFGSQSQLKFLPESQTDFIFAVIAEELGFLGVALVIGLYGIIMYRLIVISKRSHDNFGLYLVLGALLVLFAHAAINIGMNLGLLPVTGLTLPLISYGGSSFIATCILIGLAQSVAARS